MNIKNPLSAKLLASKFVDAVPANNPANTSSAPFSAPAADGASRLGELRFYGQMRRAELLTPSDVASTGSSRLINNADGQYSGDDSSYDGYIIGADGNAYPPGTPLGEIPAETEPPRIIPPESEEETPPEATAEPGPTPESEDEEPTPVSTETAAAPTTPGPPTGTPVPITAEQTNPGETIIVVNGIKTTREQAAENVRLVAEETGGRVYGVYNATEGPVKDAWQWRSDYSGNPDNAATETLTDLIYTEITEGRPVRVIAHSQGAPITANALVEVRQKLLQDGYTPDEVDAMLGLVTVETHGGASENYPPGPTYIHYVNTEDPVANTVGLGDLGDVRIDDLPPNSMVYSWRDAGGPNPLDEHSFGTYLDQRREVYEGDADGVQEQQSTGESEEARDRKLEMDGEALIEEFTVTDSSGRSSIDWAAADAYLARVAQTDPAYAEQLRQYLKENDPGRVPVPEPVPEPVQE